jgi:hypothetical protein
MRTSRLWRAGLVTAAAVALPASLAATTVVASPAVAAASRAVTVGITTRSAQPKVSGHTLVVYRGPSGTRTALVSGTVTGIRHGDKATLWFKSFGGRFTRGASEAPTGGRYSFTVRPQTVTSYQVRVSGPGISGTPASGVRNVYVEGLGNVTGKRSCKRPTCHITLHLYVSIPSSAYRTEAAKHWYLYLGLRLSSWRTPPAPKYLNLDSAATASAPQRKHLWQFEVTLHYKFKIGTKDGYTWRVNFCTRDSVTTDGLGLPGHHGCGDNRIRATIGYLG